MSKIFSIVLLGILATACGKGGTGGSGQSTTPSVNPIQSACNTYSRSDSLIDLAVKANTGRIKCKLTEEEVVEMIRNAP